MREQVTRDRVIQTAVALADAEGIDAVSMRSVATGLGVVPMALYRHVANKDDLLGGMVDAIIASYAPPAESGHWKASVRERVLSARTALLRHQWARRVIESRTTRTMAVLGHMDAVAGAFIAGGLSPDLAHHAMHALGHRIWGFSPEAFDDPEALAPPDDPSALEEMVQQVSALFPNIVAIASASSGGDLSGGGRCDEQYEFEFTLDLILDGVELLHRNGWRSPGSAL